MAETKEGKKILTEEHFNKYMAEIKQYRQRVIERKAVLSSEETGRLETLGQELFDKYTGQSVYKVISEIVAIVSSSKLREESRIEQELRNEYEQVSNKYLYNGKLDEKDILKRICNLQPLFSDNHL